MVSTGSRHLSPTATSNVFPNLGSTDKSMRRKPTSVTYRKKNLNFKNQHYNLIWITLLWLSKASIDSRISIAWWTAVVGGPSGKFKKKLRQSHFFWDDQSSIKANINQRITRDFGHGVFLQSVQCRTWVQVKYDSTITNVHDTLRRWSLNSRRNNLSEYVPTELQI